MSRNFLFQFFSFLWKLGILILEVNSSFYAVKFFIYFRNKEH